MHPINSVINYLKDKYNVVSTLHSGNYLKLNFKKDDSTVWERTFKR